MNVCRPANTVGSGYIHVIYMLYIYMLYTCKEADNNNGLLMYTTSTFFVEPLRNAKFLRSIPDWYFYLVLPEGPKLYRFFSVLLKFHSL